MIFPIGAALIGLYASKIYGFNSATGRSLLLITGGFICWALGEIIWYVLKNFMNSDPFPSLTDVFFLLGYPLLFVGIYQGFVMAEIKLKTIKKSLLIMLLLASILLTILVAYFGIYQAYDSNVNLVTNIVAMSYGVVDLVLVIASMFTILAANEYQGGKLASFWKTMTLGFILFLIADILFAVYGEQYVGDIKPYVYIDLIWIAGYLVLAFGMLENIIHVSAIQKKIKLKFQQIK
jgi:hypothetical protein